jgi:hypothetical protein
MDAYSDDGNPNWERRFNMKTRSGRKVHADEMARRGEVVGDGGGGGWGEGGGGGGTEAVSLSLTTSEVRAPKRKPPSQVACGCSQPASSKCRHSG